MLDLKFLESLIDEALSNETTESLLEWLHNNSYNECDIKMPAISIDYMNFDYKISKKSNINGDSNSTKLSDIQSYEIAA